VPDRLALIPNEKRLSIDLRFLLRDFAFSQDVVADAASAHLNSGFVPRPLTRLASYEVRIYFLRMVFAPG
jgi:hypothetical protein